MRPTIHTQTKVQPEHRIEVLLPELEDGETVDVIVMRPESQSASEGFTRDEFLKFISLPRATTARTADQIDADLQAERDSNVVCLIECLDQS